MGNVTFFFDNNSLCDRVYEYLRGQIMSGQLPPNTKLPETELASTMNVSRAPIREALNMLANDGFVVRVPRHGAVGAPVTKKEIDENWDLRLLLEPYAAKTACACIPEKELHAVRQQLMDVLDVEDFSMYMDADYKTHSVIYQHVPNSQLQNILHSTMLNSMRYRYFVENSCPTGRDIMHAVCREHLTIIDALLRRDEESAYRSMHSHIQQGYQRIQTQFAQIHSNPAP